MTFLPTSKSGRTQSDKKLMLIYPLLLKWLEDEKNTNNLLSDVELFQSKRVFISCHSQEQGLEIVQDFYEALETVGHKVFMANVDIQLGEKWAERIDKELEECDYFILFLSKKSASSEMLIEELLLVKELQVSRTDKKPVIFPIRINLSLDEPLNYYLRNHLSQIQQREWKSSADTPIIIQEVLNLLSSRELPIAVVSDKESEITIKPAIERLDSPPFPLAEPELPGGAIEEVSPFYIERPPIENECYHIIRQPGAFIRITSPRQMGKTSLLARILHHAKQEGFQVVYLSFQEAEERIFQELDKFLRWFCLSVSRQLGVSVNKVKELWEDEELFGSMRLCTVYFKEYLLINIKNPFILALDELDRLFSYPNIADDFLNL